MANLNYIPKILLLCPNPSDATSWYRGVGVWHKLKNIDFYGRYSQDTDVSWSKLSGIDILLLQRPFWVKSGYLQAIKIAKDNKVPVIIDYDDLFGPEIPKYNPARKHFKNPEDVKNMEEMISLANVIIVTTEELKNRFIKLNENVVVIPNAFNDFIFKFENTHSTKKLLNWRGSPTHSMDLLSIVHELQYIKNRYKEFELNFIGEDSELLEDYFEYKTVPVMDIVPYHHYIYDLHPKVQLSPLLNNLFNKCKSNISWIEGTYSGAVTIAPNYLPEFNKPGVILYDNPEHFKKLLEYICRNDIDTQSLYKQSFEFIAENLLLSKVNKLRAHIVTKVLEHDFR